MSDVTHDASNEAPSGSGKHSRTLAVTAVIWAIALAALAVTIVVRLNTELTERAERRANATTTTTPATTPSLGTISEPRPVDPSTLNATQQRAAEAARESLAQVPWSRAIVINQLTTGNGVEQERYSASDAALAVDSLNVDWDQNALSLAESLIEDIPYSRAALTEQLSPDFGFTIEEANFAVNAIDIDWDEQAVRYAREHIDNLPTSRESLYQLMTLPKHGGFTEAQATLAIDGLNIDWNAEATEAANQIVAERPGVSCGDLIDALTGDNREFTAEQARAGAEAVGVC